MSKEIKGLNRTITLWNESRLDLFAISLPDKNFEFHGVIRFYHQDSANDGKYATKCVRVSSTAATVDVIETLSEKFRADMRMLTKPNYALYEVHADGETRKLEDSENPLIVQLGWIKDDREGRFLLRNEDDKYPVHVGNGLYEESEETIKGFKLTRNLTKKEKKQKKKEDKEKLHQKNKSENIPANSPAYKVSAAKQLYNEVPESTFTRTVSNPEAVMKKRREQKLQKRGAEMLKVYGDSINAEIPYKTLLLLPTDKTDTVIRDTLDKYGMGKESTADYMMVQVVLPPGSKPEECFDGSWGKETVLTEDECPLDIEQKWQPHQGTLVFQLRVRTGSNDAKKKKKTPSESQDQSVNDKLKQDQADRQNKKTAKNGAAKTDKRTESQRGQRPSNRPKLIELLGSGSQLQAHDVVPNVTEIGNDRRNATYGPFIELRNAPGLLSSHCVITNMDGVVTVTPHDGKGEVFVNGKPIEETTMLSHGAVLWLGRNKHLVFCDPGRDISPAEIQKAVRGSMAKEQRSHKLSQNRLPSSSQQRERPGSDSDRPRHYSTASTSSSKSGSLNRGSHPGQERAQLQNIPEDRNYQRPPQQRKVQPPHQQPPPQEGYHQRNAVPPQTATVQPVQQRKPQQLPVYLQVNRDSEDSLITEILSVRANHLHFKLSPAYSVYLIQRHFVERDRNRIASSLTLVTDLLEQTVQMNCASVSELSFWMANTSELLNFIRQDQDLTSATIEMQETFAKTVQLSFRHLVQCMQRTLFDLMPAFLSDSDEDLPGGGDAIDLKKQNQNSDDPTMYDILHMLSSAMSLLRKCRVNAALTIQLFSQLFHSINMWLFNKLVASRESRQLCCREWGMRIRARLAMVETWAEKQGLELAADCHLARITQATHLLQAPKQSGDDIAAISGTCFKLNSLQLRALLSNYQPRERDNERRISQELIDKVVAVAENSADELTRSDGRDVCLEEDPDLQLPFLLPEDGYSCDVVRGVPTGLTEFIKPFVEEGFCTYQEKPKGSDSWTVHFQSYASQPPYQNNSNSSLPPVPDHSNLPPQPEVVTIQFHKRGGGMGLSIVAARGAGQDKLGIYIRSVVKGGASDLDGRLQAGDQLLSVDGQTLVGVDQARAAALMTRTGQTVTLEIAKQGAVYHGLATLLSQPSPQMQHPSFAQRRMNAQPRPKSEGYSLYAAPNAPSRQKTTNYVPHIPSYGMQGGPFTSQNRQPSALNSSTPHLNPVNHPILSPQPIYSPRKNKYSRSTDSTFVTVEPTTTGSVPLYSQRQSSSAHSVASLGESSSTSDSGFNSVAAPQPLLPSPNSAFSIRFAAPNSLLSHNGIPPSSPGTDVVAHSSTRSVSSDLASTELGDTESCFERTSSFDYDQTPRHIDDPVSHPMHEEESNTKTYDSDADSYVPRRGRQRYRQELTRGNAIESDTDNNDAKNKQLLSPGSRFMTKTELRRSADRRALFGSFLAQAEERDKKAQMEQQAMDSLPGGRTRSASLNRASSTSYTARATIPTRSTSLTRSNSTSASSRPAIASGLRRSTSNVDIKEIINKAEKRDRHARVEQARTEGLIPPRRYLGRKDSVRTRSHRPASLIIQDFEKKVETDSPALAGHSRTSESYKTPPDYTTTDSRRTADPRSTVGSHHRKFSSFLNSSRLSRSGGGQYNTRHYPDDNRSESYRSSLYRAHSARSSTWNGSEIRYTKHPPLSTDPEMSDSKYNSRYSRTTDKGHDYETSRQKQSNAPRPAMSMGNLQQTNQDANVGSPRGWRRNKDVSHKPAESSSIANTRRKATSQTTLPSFGDSSTPNKKPDDQGSVFDKRSYPRKQISSPLYSPSENLPSPPSSQPPPSDPLRSFDKFPQNALDNPNYDHFPPPPPDLTNDNSEEIAKRHFQPVRPDPSPPAEPIKNDISTSHDSPVEKRSPPPPLKKDIRSPVNRRSAQTLGRPGSSKKPEVARVTPTQKKKQSAQASSKSSTLPRHFKSASPWERDEREKKEQSIQEQLNALRDEEISELMARTDLSPLEEERLKNLLQERDFQARVQEEKMRMFSDEDISEEDYSSVPDRPDRDRLIRLEGAHAQRNSTSDKEDKDRIRWEEEQKRKKEEAEIRAKLEAERREERRRERERQEEKRRKEAEQRELQKQNEERARIQKEKEREEEKWRSDLQKQNEERARIQRDKEKEEEKRRNELQKQNEERARMQREKEEEKWRNDYNSLQREEEEHRRRLDELRRMREEEENQLREIQAKREAEERSLRHGTLQRREQEKLTKQKEADAREEAEREYLEAKLSAGKPASNASSFKKHSPYSPRSFTAFSSSNEKNNRSSPSYESTKPVMRVNSKSSSIRPVSDGYMLGKTDWSMDDLPPPPAPTTPTASYGRRPISYVASTSTPGVIGSQEIYNDPRNKREASMKRDQSFKRKGPDPSRLAFKDRQRLFQGGVSSPATKPKTSRRLLEIEENLRGQL